MPAHRREDDPGGYVHLVPPWGRLTQCCAMPISDISLHDEVSHDPVEVTCPVSRRKAQRLEVMVEYEASLQEKAEETYNRLLRLRARIARASSGEINSRLRDELLGLIDRG